MERFKVVIGQEEIKKHLWPIGNRDFSWAKAFVSQREKENLIK